MTFDVTSHLTKIKGGQLYLPVKDRLIWLRDEHPDAVISTEMVQLDLDGKMAIFRAQVMIPNRGSATGFGSETERDFPAGWVEKAETKAVGRALAALGFGTQFATELDEGDRLVDTPIATRSAPESTPRERAITQAMQQNADNGGSRTPATRGTARTSAPPARSTAPSATPEQSQAEALQKGIVRARMAEAEAGETVQVWRDVERVAVQKYGMQPLSTAQKADAETRLGWLIVLAERLPKTQAEREAEVRTQPYMTRLLAATSRGVLAEVVQEARADQTLLAEDLESIVRQAAVCERELTGTSA